MVNSYTYVWQLFVSGRNCMDGVMVSVLFLKCDRSVKPKTINLVLLLLS